MPLLHGHQAIYSRLFDRLIVKINAALTAGTRPARRGPRSRGCVPIAIDCGRRRPCGVPARGVAEGDLPKRGLHVGTRKSVVRM